MNGTKITEIKNMTEGEFRVLLVTKMDEMHEDQAAVKKEQGECKKELKATKRCLTQLKVEVAKIPPHCIQTETLKEQDKRLDELEKKNAASSAVKTLMLGAGGGGGLVGAIVLVLKFVLDAF